MPAPASARRRSRAISLRHHPPPTCPAALPPCPPHTPPVFPPPSPPLPSPRPAPLWRAFGRSRALRVWCALRSSRGSSRPQAPRCSRPTPTAPSRFASSAHRRRRSSSARACDVRPCCQLWDVAKAKEKFSIKASPAPCASAAGSAAPLCEYSEYPAPVPPLPAQQFAPTRSSPFAADEAANSSAQSLLPVAATRA